MCYDRFPLNLKSWIVVEYNQFLAPRLTCFLWINLAFIPKNAFKLYAALQDAPVLSKLLAQCSLFYWMAFPDFGQKPTQLIFGKLNVQYLMIVYIVPHDFLSNRASLSIMFEMNCALLVKNSQLKRRDMNKHFGKTTFTCSNWKYLSALNARIGFCTYSIYTYNLHKLPIPYLICVFRKN